jgi:hypothetical protein
LSEIDPTDHALATIASILEHPEPVLVLRETETARETETVTVTEMVVAGEHGAADEYPMVDEHPVVEEQPLVPEHADADGYSKVGPGPMVAIRLKWTVHRGDDGQFYVHETIGEQSVPVVSGPMTGISSTRMRTRRIGASKSCAARSPAAARSPITSARAKPSALSREVDAGSAYRRPR